MQTGIVWKGWLDLHGNRQTMTLNHMRQGPGAQVT